MSVWVLRYRVRCCCVDTPTCNARFDSQPARSSSTPAVSDGRHTTTILLFRMSWKRGRRMRYAIVDDTSGRWEVSFEAVEYDWESAARIAESNSRTDVARALRTGRV